MLQSSGHLATERPLKKENMIKKFFRIIKYPLSIIAGGYAYFWLIMNPLETYSIPIILYWLPDTIGWHGFFIVCGILAALVVFILCASIGGEEWTNTEEN